MYPNPLIYCTCWDPWNLGPRKLIKTPRPPTRTSIGKPKLAPLPPAAKKQSYVQPTTKPFVGPKVTDHLGKQEESTALPTEVINVSPGYRLIRNREQISVTLGDEMFEKKKQLKSEIMDKIKISRADIITDLEEQISELTVIIEQMNRDHQSAQKLLSDEMALRCAEMKENFENKNRELKEAHAAELSQLENSYKASLKAEKLAAQEKLDEMGKEYKYLKNMFHMYQDSIYDEMEDRWSKKKADWEREEKLEREKILLQQKHKMTKKFELESIEEKKKINDSYTAVFENFIREKEELLKQHENDTLQLAELRKTKQVMEEELNTQAVILETLNTTLYQTQMELQKEKATVGNLEKMFQIKLAEAEEKFKYTIQLLTEENIHLRQKIIAKNEEIYEERCGRSTSIYENDSDILEDDSNEKQEL
ncbi:flagellum-associated coiled-coil domain-containing protein 1 isoform X1 [Mustela lutreola]|uniref:flagellum-associated coiled-coil domain-containing protein 1 isoform X1 n=1 Tax=Mustela lutreola TaxID=9666 RepID=UPI0027979FDF|nr:flagellum-associated coiled-coil domain-containing protein 1 isoform X1 [Mustela lutreola]XP_059024407.1 flagellum-associated coiled-coil domain-containing protein 1 isoform X1 [Mustela lutreola]XP_059024408.1 flagellum-associated coiled-coil domain-containing protein 1 isoform X1 [Mustela lutreola]XP_059024409.1 flagellum-associated coiled-coil domain-containing protein 1 isoform X1 [Mustela lutreola]XP_059024410.1 flagellum-associated coiled-coil domain-containing protein 1 isoform X1 [Mus